MRFCSHEGQKTGSYSADYALGLRPRPKTPGHPSGPGRPGTSAFGLGRRASATRPDCRTLQLLPGKPGYASGCLARATCVSHFVVWVLQIHSLQCHSVIESTMVRRLVIVLLLALCMSEKVFNVHAASEDSRAVDLNAAAATVRAACFACPL